jgi:hypothetical protein
MIISWKRTFAALGVAMVLGAAPAMSAEWTRDTRNGGQITRSVTRDGTSIQARRRASGRMVQPTRRIRPAVTTFRTGAGAAIPQLTRTAEPTPAIP